jgi:hypothetical protein
MFRFTTLAMLLALAFTTAVLTGCDNKSTGSQSKSPMTKAPEEKPQVPEPATVPKP